ncbi:alpha/beta hydrolase family protein [candidate division KSB1 bacterium]
MSKAGRIYRTLFIITVSAAVIAAAYAVHYYTKDHVGTLLEFRRPYISAEVTYMSEDTVTSVYSVILKREFRPDLNCYMRKPVRGGKYPAMILLGGLNSGKDAINLVGELDLVRDLIIMTIDYPYEGRTKNVGVLEFLREVPSIRNASFDTAASVSVLIDFLETLTDYDQENIFVTGGSFGCFFAIAAGAIDSRIKGVASLYGGGDISMLIKDNFHWGPGFVRATAGFLAEFLVLPVEPMRYVDKIAPRHFLMVNGLDDERIPEASVAKLFERAGEPKELIWFKSDHIQPTPGKLTQELTEVVAQWLVESGLIQK